MLRKFKSWLSQHRHMSFIRILRFLLYSGRRLWGKPVDFNLPLLGMTTLEEQKLFEKYAKRVNNLNGVILDLGCWMCSTTISLARGAKKEKIIGVDRFIWEKWMDCYLGMVKKDYQTGDNFIAEVKQRVEECGDRIDLIQADLTVYQWIREPIKLLLVDAMKSRLLVEQISKAFYPFLIINGLLIHQDFMHYNAPWIHILQYRLKDYFQLIEEVEEGGTVVFQLVKRLPSELIKTAADFSVVTDSKTDQAFQYWLKLLKGPGRSSIAAAHIHFYKTQMKESEASKLLEEYETEKILVRGDLK